MTSALVVLCTFLIVVCSARNRWAKHARDNLIEWKTTECAVHNGEQTEPCPSPSSNGEWPCIRYSDLCNGQRDCPNGEDEFALQCHFHQLHRAEMDAIREKLHRMTVEFNRREASTL